MYIFKLNKVFESFTEFMLWKYAPTWSHAHWPADGLSYVSHCL